ncbi:MAG: autotransporter domain-containing protein, partial [Elusimicrobiales bacterium]|nr:autotransporter domain-containing protein [Elusimicrobiales bacterium]
TGSIAQNDVNNTGVFNNAGAITAAGDVNNTGSVVNVGTITATGNIVNAGTLTSDASALSAAAIDNNGTLEFTGGTNANNIAGTGDMLITGDVTNNAGAAINQSALTINSGASFTGDADDITTVNHVITNNGSLTFNADGTNANRIEGTGSLNTSGDITNNANITQDSLNIVSGTFTNTKTVSAEEITNAGTILNNGYINASGLDNTGALSTNVNKYNVENTNNTSSMTLTGNGNLAGNIYDDQAVPTGVLNINGKINNADDMIIQQDAVNLAAASSLTTNADYLIANNVNNDGELVLTGGTIDAAMNINDGAAGGNLKITGAVENEGTISQHIDITKDGYLETDANNIAAGTATEGITNKGTLDLTGGTLTVAVDGSGTTEITGAVVNASSMTQRSIEITAGSSLTTSADDVSASVFANNGTLIFNAAGQTNNNVITGNGDLSITASLDNQRSVSQENIDISADLSNASVMIASNNIDQTAGTITNTGRLEAGNAINVAGIIDNDGIINAGIINVAAAGTINTGASNINAAIVNAGTLNFSEGVTGNSISGTGTLNVTAGTVLNTGTIEQNDINVSSSAVFVNNTNVNVTNDLVANGNVSNSSIFNVGNDATIGNGTDAVIMNNTGYFTAANSVTVSSAASIVNDGSFTADTLVINAGADVDNNGKISAENGITNNGTLTTNASDIIDSAIANNASLEFTGGINDNSITGATGNLLVSGALVNRADITQNVIDVNNSLVNYSTITASDINNIGYMENAGTGNITVSGQINNSATAQFVTAAGSVSGDIANDGLLTFKGNGNAYADNITGTGTLLIEDMSLDLTGATVAQQNINIASVSSVTANASGITADSIVNDGRLEFASAGQNTAGIAEIAGNGSLVFSAVSTVSSSTVITQNSIANTNTLTNNGSLTAESFSATGDVDNHNVIKADEISVTGATAENAAGSGTMEADRIVLTNAQLNTSASAISVSDYVSLDGSVLRFTNEPNPFGVASYDIRAAIGSGSAVEVAANTYMTGNNTLFFGDIGIGDIGVAPTQLIVNNEDNLGYADIYFLENGSSLVVAGKADISNDMYANGNNIDIIVENDNDVTLSGDIDKLGFTGVDFTKDGAGTLTLTQNAGVNTYENTNILDGKLIGNTGNINGTVNLLAGSAVEFRDSDALVNLNAISGNGTVIINHELGSLGRTDINANPFAADALIIESGRVALNGANIMADTVNAKNGTIVQGTGTIGGNTTANTVMTIESGAKFTPGNSIGTINVTGDLNLNGGSMTEIEVSPAAFDLINVSNNVNIASGAGMEVISTVAGDSYLNNVSYDVLTGAAVNGEFDYDGSVKSIYGGVIDFVDGSRLVGSLDYSPTAVTLTIARKGADFEGKVRNLEIGSHNRVEVAKAMDNIYKLGSGIGAGMEAMLMQAEYILGLEDKQIVNTHANFKEALLDLAGVLYANASLEPLTNAKSAHVYDRIVQKADNPKASCPTCHDSVWANVYTSHDKFYGTGNSRMFTNDITGTIAGYDRSSSENGILLGVMMGGANSDIDMNGDRMDIHDYTLGVYGGYQMDEWTFKGMVYGGYQEYNATRNINFMQETAQASYHGNSFTVDAEASYDFNWNAFGGVKVTPYAGALISLSHQGSFVESGAGDLNLRVHNADMENIRVRFGLNFAGEETETGNWYANIGVKQILGPSYNRLGMKFATTNNTEMDIYSAETGCTVFSAGLGGTYNLSDSWKLFGNAEGSISGDAYGAFGNVGVSYQW